MYVFTLADMLCVAVVVHVLIMFTNPLWASNIERAEMWNVWGVNEASICISDSIVIDGFST